MTVKKIWFETMEDINRFLNETEKFPFDVDLRCGSKIVDAKSALGVAAMGIRKELDLCAYVPSPEPDFYSKLSFCMR
ncbi:MAG: HPr family phosphocarrier protein [Eubacteriales bacterium]|nr:HPr family phosphocarrier protein [Eubacteriales bacterium]